MDIVNEVEHRKGARISGHFCELATGETIYLAKRKHGQMFRAGHGTISMAMAKADAGWAFDEIALYNLRAKGIACLGIRTTDTHWLYLTQMASYFDGAKSRINVQTGYSAGNRQRWLPLIHFTITESLVELPLDQILAV